MWGIEFIGFLNEEERTVTLQTPKEIVGGIPEQTASYWQSRCKRAEDKLNRVRKIIKIWYDGPKGPLEYYDYESEIREILDV